jgi:hypothetical protein
MIQIEYKVASEYNVSTDKAKAEVMRRVAGGPWATAHVVKLAKKAPLIQLERLAIAEIAEQIKGDCEAATRLGLAYSINDSRVFIDARNRLADNQAMAEQQSSSERSDAGE